MTDDSTIVRTAGCSCGAVEVTCRGEPVRISACHCLACQRRSGSAFAAQARWPDAAVSVRGATSEWVRIGDTGGGATYRFCPRCGSTVAYTVEQMPGVTAVPIGAFADPGFPAPGFSVYEERRHAWTAILGDAVAHEW